MTRACAPGKIILLGEHAVVYGRPALAVPLRQVQACARITPADDGPAGDLRIEAPALGLHTWHHRAPPDNPLGAAVRAGLEALAPGPFEPLRLEIESTIPMASGLGSSAAVSVAILRALNHHFGGGLTDAQISDLAFGVEVIQHGTPSGIDNTVVALDRPVLFVRGRTPEPLEIGATLHLVVGDTGVAASTGLAVAEVRRRREADPGLEAVFDSIGELVEQARQAIVLGDPARLGGCMQQNHGLLRRLGVSSPELDRLVAAAMTAGALGAKLSGGGMGGNMLAVCEAEASPAVALALQNAGAAGVIQSEAGAVIFLKLGGSLITEKNRAETARVDVLRRLSNEIAAARRADPELRLLVGHGSGSFGHAVASRTRTHLGASSPEDWLGFAEVWRSANRLNRIVVDALAEAGLPVISFPPSASAAARSGDLTSLAVEPIKLALQRNLVPLVQGDVAFDAARGACIVSTERVFSWLAPRLRPRRILLAGADPGVFSDFPANQDLMPTVSQGPLTTGALGGSSALDVTGGMADKVRSALDWVRLDPQLDVRIFSGEAAGQVEQALLGGQPGTRVVWRDETGGSSDQA